MKIPRIFIFLFAGLLSLSVGVSFGMLFHSMGIPEPVIAGLVFVVTGGVCLLVTNALLRNQNTGDQA